MFHSFPAPLRLLARLLLIAYFLVGLLVLGTRYWLLPTIDQFRPFIVQQLSQALDTPISVGQVSAQWTGLNPSFALKDVVLTDAKGQQVLRIPSVRAHFSWRSLLAREIRFQDLHAYGADLTVHRNNSGHVEVLGQSMHMGAAAGTQPLDVGAISWLTSQRQIVLRDTVIRWVDETRDAPPLVLRSVGLNIHNLGARHTFSLTATPPPELGDVLELRGDFYRGANTGDDVLAVQAVNGQLYARTGGMRPLGWAPWLNLPTNLRSGQVSAQAWLELVQGEIDHVTASVSVEQGEWALDDSTLITTDSTRIYADGPYSAFLAWNPVQEDAPASTQAAPPAIDLRVQSAALALRDSSWFQYPLAADSLNVVGRVWKGPQGANVQIQRMDVQNADLDASLRGSWQQDGSAAGLVDVKGLLRRASVGAIHRYLPNEVDIEARDWLRTGLVSGDVYDGELVLKGELTHFPFGINPDKGDFYLAGKHRNTVIDYLPPEGQDLGWPALLEVDGTVALRRAGLQVAANKATMLPDGKTAIHLADVSAHIADLEHEAVLEVTGATQGPAAAYLGLMANSPLGQWLDHVFDQATGSGDWKVPLALTIPLADPELGTVQGSLQFDDATLLLSPDLPTFQNITGELAFTQDTVTAHKLKAKFLGGQASISGNLGAKAQGLVLQGNSTAAALQDYITVPGMARFTGTAPYRLHLQWPQGKALSLDLRSDLVGMAMDFPAPLGKSADAALPLQARWQRLAGSNKMQLALDLGSHMAARFVHDPKDMTGPYFYAGAIGVNKKPVLLPQGVNVDIQTTRFNADAWQKVADQFAAPSVTTTEKPAAATAGTATTAGTTATTEKTINAGATALRPLFPAGQQLRLQAKQAQFLGVLLDELTYTVIRPQPDQLRVDITSSQTAGTLRWREHQGKISGAVQADFHRLALGSAKSSADSEDAEQSNSLEIPDDLDLPAINLKVEQLHLYGQEVGTLAIAGVNQARGQVWSLESLALSGPGTTLSGSGTWRLHGPDRGLVLDATVKTTDLGKYFEHIGLDDVLQGGKGSLQGTFEWRNMPWNFSKADLNGKIQLELDEGRFQTLGSRSARLLEFLSFQSFSRLARLDLSPINLTKEGFPFDNLRGTLSLDKGVLRTDNYRVIGPVGTIVLDGYTDLETERLDAQAVVIPNLDVSGAAIAAGIAINPIVGIGTFLTQWLLKEPLAKAMTVQYQIGGTWDEPEVTALENQP